MEKGKQASRKRVMATKKLVPLFLSYYEDFHEEEYLPNWPMVKSAEKVGAFYDSKQVTLALNYYFASRTKHDLWEFINDIDKLYTASIEGEKKAKELRELVKETNAKLNKLISIRKEEIERRSGIDN